MPFGSTKVALFWYVGRHLQLVKNYKSLFEYLKYGVQHKTVSYDSNHFVSFRTTVLTNWSTSYIMIFCKSEILVIFCNPFIYEMSPKAFWSTTNATLRTMKERSLRKNQILSDYKAFERLIDCSKWINFKPLSFIWRKKNICHPLIVPFGGNLLDQLLQLSASSFATNIFLLLSFQLLSPWLSKIYSNIYFLCSLTFFCLAAPLVSYANICRNP